MSESRFFIDIIIILLIAIVSITYNADKKMKNENIKFCIEKDIQYEQCRKLFNLP